YRTGDLARLLPSGDVDFLGRMDGQVKVRGQRLELGEIEAALRRHPAVAAAVALAPEHALRGRTVVAFVTPSGVPEPSPPELLSHLRRYLPAFMVPSSLRVLDALPTTPNGKVDRRILLRVAEEEPPGDAGAAPAPRTPTEELLVGIWEEVLGVERPGMDRGFFDLGGHSLLAMRAVSRIRANFGVELPLQALFESPSIRDLALRLERLREDGTAPAEPLVPAPRDQDPPLTFAQRRLWFIDQLEPGSRAYNVPLAVTLDGALSVAALARSLSAVVRRHEALRTTYPAPSGEPAQRIGEPAPVSLPVADLSGLGLRVAGGEAGRLNALLAGRRFDLAAGPVIRGTLLRLAPRRHIFSLVVHHIAVDEWALRILAREIEHLYRGFLAGAPAQLPALPVQYADFALWQHRRFRGGALERELAHWREVLAGAPVLELPTDRPRPALRSGRGGRHRFQLPAGLSRRLRALARESGATLFMTVLAGFQALLARHAGQTDWTVGTPISGRDRQEVEGLVGFFLNTLVLRADLGGAPTFRELLVRVRRTALAAYAHQDLPFERLV
ncbi:MAG TPA: condensation domain-containing protein, partial [Thermoanaerobaculia bacterium]|nr:condensation domain-containing protein [Thermoanaerobaculia bacterium]